MIISSVLFSFLLFAKQAETLRAPSTVRSCKAERLQGPLTLEKVESLLKNKKIKTPEDFVCCMPEDYLERYVTIHTSRALQSGVPNSPRVILINKNHFTLNNFDMALTITGDDPLVHGHNNIEIIFNNTQKKEMELFDIDFNLKKNRLSKANPSQCLGCHSPDQRETVIGGIKPIFENAPWPFLTGASHFTVGHTKRYIEEFEKRSLQALSQQKRYACLNPQTLAHHAESITQFDSITSEMVSRRNAKLIKASQDYKMFRPLLVGIDSECFASAAITDTGLENFEKEIVKWIPESKLNTLFVQQNFLLQSSQKVLDLHKYLLQFRQREVDQEIKLRSEQIENSKDSRAGALFQTSRNFIELGGDDLATVKKRVLFHAWSKPSADISKYLPITQSYARFTADTIHRSELGGGPNPLLRMIFEGRGLSILTWNRDMGGGYGTSGLGFITDHLFKLEKEDPFWQGVHPLILQTRQLNNDDSGNPVALQKVCGLLAEQSLKELSQ